MAGSALWWGVVGKMPPIDGTGASQEISIDTSNWTLPDFTGMFTGGYEGAYVPPASSSSGGVTAWLNANAKTVLIAAGVFAGVMFLTGGRRR